MKVRKVLLPSGMEVLIKKPGPVTIEKVLGYLPLATAEILEPEKSRELLEKGETDGFKGLVDHLCENLGFARKLICAVALKPRFSDQDPPPAGHQSLDDLDFADYWKLFLEAFRFTGLEEAVDLVRPTSPTPDGSRPTTPSVGDTTDVPAGSSALN